MAVEYVDMVALEGGLTDSVASKLSSTALRRHVLGEYRTPKVDRTISPGDGEGPFVIGLTGGMASGKSSLCQRLAQLGAKVVDCDKVRLGAYRGDGGGGSSVLIGRCKCLYFLFMIKLNHYQLNASVNQLGIIQLLCTYVHTIKL